MARWTAFALALCLATGIVGVTHARQSAFISSLSLLSPLGRSSAQQQHVGDPLPAPSCKLLECPTFSVVHEGDGFEIRKYRNATWVETELLADVSFAAATVRGFDSLFKYIGGANDGHKKIDMTAPVVTKIVPSAGPFCSSAFVVAFHLPSRASDSPPHPSSSLHPALSIASGAPRCVAVRKFGGFATDFNVAIEASKLADSLKQSRWDAVEIEASYAIAQYSAPFEVLGRVNEVWVSFGGAGSSCDPDDSAPAPA